MLLARITREQSQAQTRARILEAASVVVAREGYEGASIDRITEEAGFSKGAFYSNFTSKEDLFLELLEIHAGQDVLEIGNLLKGATEPEEIIDIVSDWASSRAADTTWGLLALELFRRARRDATFGERHATLFQRQWEALGEMLRPLFMPGKLPAEPAAIGGVVFEITYGAASSFTAGPQVRDLVYLALRSFYGAHGAKRRRRPREAAREGDAQ